MTIVFAALFFVILAIIVRSWLKEAGEVFADFLFIVAIFLTFPGMVSRQYSERLFCYLAGVPVYKTRYVPIRDPAGSIIHDKVDRYRDTYLLTVGPFITCSLLAGAAFVPVCLGMGGIAGLALLWLGASFAFHALPGDGNAGSLWRQSKLLLDKNPLMYAGYPLVELLMAASNFRKIIRANYVYPVVLYSVTFCALAVVLVSGAALFPDTYAVNVTATLPAFPSVAIHSPATDTQAINPSDVYKSVYQQYVKADSAGKEATAKDWLPVAEAEMSVSDKNAILVFITGSSSGKTDNLPIDGKSHMWWYQYAAPELEKYFNIYVHDGVTVRVTEEPLDNQKAANITGMDDLRAINWTRDSTDAAAIAGDEAARWLDGALRIRAVYRLQSHTALNNYRGPMWTVLYSGKDGRTTMIYMIDHNDGRIVHRLKSPG